ncbi:hypothetical protein QVD17_41177 [Tagetes erecta]|uniref:Uncharacterized protein n=1 Tax=Tagetes erecta TaxID=13708 RepID=A0AAD8JSW7_TARER|nr:hypothetical protein QVD17_41177 [Tagetes erecta]
MFWFHELVLLFCPSIINFESLEDFEVVVVYTCIHLVKAHLSFELGVEIVKSFALRMVFTPVIVFFGF